MTIDLSSIISFLIGFGVLLIPLYFKGRANTAAINKTLDVLKSGDTPLAEAEKQIQAAIKTVMDQDDSKLTPEERAKRWEK